MEDTEKLQESWEQEHNQTLEKHETNASSLTVQLKESLTESCESEKASIEDTITEKCERAKGELKDELRDKLKLFSKKATRDAAASCEVKMAEFKQSYVERYEEDIQQFTERMNIKI